MPLSIKTDNGAPFASPHSLFNLSNLSVWWLGLGIAIERIEHQALDVKFRAEIYTRFNAVYKGLPTVEYLMHDRKLASVVAAGSVLVK